MVVLGTISELTAKKTGTPTDLSHHSSSDRRLKKDLRPVDLTGILSAFTAI
jgi:hypothetical protein